MVQLGDVIEIESSPEPAPRSATPKPRDKGKRKATPYRLGLAPSVIELTDSETEPNVKSPTGRSQNHVAPMGQSPSAQKQKNKASIPDLDPYTLRPSGSLDNIPTPNDVFASSSGSGTGAGPLTQQPTPANAHAQTLFLTSDEENEQPASIAPIGRVDGEVIEEPLAAIIREPTIPILNPDPQPQVPTRTNSPDSAPTPDLDPILIEDMDPTSTAVAQILEIIPNVEPTHLLELVETHLPTFSVFHGDHNAGGGEGVEAARESAREGEGAREATVEEQVQGVVGHVLHLLFEDSDYPRADLRHGKGKGKRVAEDAEDKGKGKAKDVAPKKPRIDYSVVDRPFPGGPNYFELALYHLQTSFPLIPKPYLRRQLQIHKNLYAPTHLSVMDIEKRFEEGVDKQRPYILKYSRSTLRKPQGDVAFEEEKAWLDIGLAGSADGNGENSAMDDDDEKVADDAVMDDADDGEDDGTGIECQCCFADYPFSKMVQCPEAHLFCSTCISTYAATQLGAHNSSLTCIHPSSCSLPFPSSELKRILPVKLYELYERLEQQKQIMQAGLVGLEECPFCEWKCVLEVSSEEDKLFRCGNEEGGCGVVSCRGCKKLDHVPKSCREVEEDKHLDGRHAIEEAMTRALMRNCPKCQKAFIKDHGCNKMSCSNCHTLSCYVCRQIIHGYDHFNQGAPGHPSTSANAKKCLLWDAVEERHAQEVKEAAEKAMEEYKRDHPDVDESAIKVDLPEVPNKAAPQVQAGHQIIPGNAINNMPPIVFPGGAMGYPAFYNPQHQMFGQAVHPAYNIQPPLPPPPPRYRRQVARHQQQPPQQAPNTRARAALIAEQQRQQAQQPPPRQHRQRPKKATVAAERARMAEQVRLAEEENRARQRLERVRDQRVVARREQQERARMAMELGRQRQRARQRQPQMQPQPQPQPQPQAQPQARAQEPYHHHHHVYHHHHLPPPQPPHRHQQQQQIPVPHYPALQNPFALGGMQQQQQQVQPHPVLVPPPKVAQNPGRGRRRR